MYGKFCYQSNRRQYEYYGTKKADSFSRGGLSVCRVRKVRRMEIQRERLKNVVAKVLNQLSIIVLHE